MKTNLDTFNKFRQYDQPSQFPGNSSQVDASIAQFDSMRQQALATIVNQYQQEKAKLEAEKAAEAEQMSYDQPQTESQQYDFSTPTAQTSGAMGPEQSGQGSMLPSKAAVTQRFGNRNSIESFSKGVNLGTDFGIKEGTPLALPPGNWKIERTFSTARPGDRAANSGSGNLVKARNVDTGETLAFEHLSQVKIGNGQVVKGGSVVGLSGTTGNSTGPHASIPYTDPNGKYRDVLNSPYAKYLFGG